MMNRSRLTTLLATVLVLAVWCGVGLAQQGDTPSQANMPQLTVSMDSFDFGRVPQGSSISHVFWLKNTGGDTLKIADVKPG